MARSRTPGTGRGVAGAGGGSGLFQISRNPTAAVLAFQNRTIAILRGTTVDEFGAESDVGSPKYTGIPAAIAEVDDVVFDAATQRPQTIRSVKCKVANWVDVEASDTIQDESTGYFYIVESLEAEPGIGYYPPRKLLSLKMRSGVSVASD